MFSLFSAGLTSDLTVVVKAGGTQGSGTSKVIKVSQHISERVHEFEFLLISYFSVDLSKLHGLMIFFVLIHIQIATLNDSAENKVAVRQLMNKFQLSKCLSLN